MRHGPLCVQGVTPKQTEQTGLEPAISDVTDRRLNQLDHCSIAHPSYLADWSAYFVF